MRLVIVQHGDALPKDVDPDRPLSEEGAKQIEALGRVLRRGGVTADAVVHSGKTRARQTAERLQEALGLKAAPAATDGLAANDPVAPFAAQAGQWRHDTIVCSHMPFVGSLVSQLLGGGPDAVNVSFEPGSAVCLERTEEDTWALQWMLRPKLVSSA